MKFGNLLTLISMALLMGATACSTTGEAQTGAPTESVAQAQSPKMNEHAAHHSDGPQAVAAQTGDKQPMMMKMCPMQVEGTTRKVVKLDGAVAMDFTTTGDVAELRTRVQKMAQMHTKMHGEGGMMHGGMMQGEGGMMHGQMQGKQGNMKHAQMHGKMSEEQQQARQQMMQMMAGATADTEQIDGGMRMTLTPKDAAQADKLVEMMQQHSQMMGEQGACPMMQMTGGGPTGHPHQ